MFDGIMADHFLASFARGTGALLRIAPVCCDLLRAGFWYLFRFLSFADCFCWRAWFALVMIFGGRQ